MKHYTDEDLILYYYDERRGRPGIQRHLETCAHCAAAYEALTAALKLLASPDAPARGDQYGLEVWQRIRHKLPEQDAQWWTRWFGQDRLVLTAALATLIVAAFVAGRWWSASDLPVPGQGTSPTPPARTATTAGDEARQRILLMSVADHLDRSERVLTDIMNAPDGGDISAEKRWAADLVATSRLYRQDAADAGEQAVASVLDELERHLLEIVHSPSRSTAAHLEEIRRRIDAASLVFKVRVLGQELRQRELLDQRRLRPVTSHTS